MIALLIAIGLIFLSLFCALNYIERQSSDKNLEVSYNEEKKHVILDGRYIVASFRAKSLNCEFFEYLYNNKDRFIPISELEDHVLRNRVCQLVKMPDQMGFPSQLKKLIFTCTNEGITYHSRPKLDADSQIKL